VKETMRNVFLSLLIMVLWVVPAVAQDDSCSAEAINEAVDELLVDYQQERPTDDAAEVIDSVGELSEELLNLVADCQATNEAEAETTDATGDGLPIEGKWMIQWRTAESVCPDGTTIPGIDRPFIMMVDAENERIIADDIFIWPPLEFTPNVDGIYEFGRNTSTFTYTYILENMAEDRIEGIIRSYIPSINCNLEDTFIMTLVDENIQCLVGTDVGANLRSGPGTDFNRAGTMPAAEHTDVIGQAIGTDNFVWWQLGNEAWIRSDIVQEAGYCDDVPEIES
jgi:hypothetical protein